MKSKLSNCSIVQLFNSRHRRAGFTLIELMVAITIIGILLALSSVAFLGARRTARDSERKADLEDIRSALEIYRADCGRYPETASVVPGSTFNGTCNSVTNTYMQQVPNDPENVTKQYFYKYQKITNSTYRLCAYTETGSGAVAACGKCDNSNTKDCNYSVTNP